MLLALVVASRFGLLCGLGLWLGVGVAQLALLPAVEKASPSPGGPALAAALQPRLELVLFIALALVLAGLGLRVVFDRAAPPSALLAPVAALTGLRLLSATAISPRLRAGWRKPSGPRGQDPGDGRAGTETSRWSMVQGWLSTLEVCFCLFALYALA